jgi:SpoVK/Ycf46/Vps4 family AAA+-type ATPase
MAHALGLKAYAISLPRTISKWVSATGENLGKIFENLTPNTVVIFDEIEAVASHRGAVETSAGKEFNSTVNTLLTLMDRNRSGVIVATTNRPDIIDPAVLRRFDEHVEFPAPSAEQMRSLADRLSDGFDIPRVPWDVIGDCQNYDAVTKVVEREARRIVMREILAAEAAAETESEPEEQSDGGEEEEKRAS